jgi:putative ATP-dependent endonuclease of OLD family
MLGKGVIVAEGWTEVVALQAVAAAMEAGSGEYYPLDLAGVSIITSDGDGSVAEFGRFFASLDIPVFAFIDKKNRTPKEVTALSGAGFTRLTETRYPGMEDLLVSEIPLERQWQYLERVRDSGSAPAATIWATRPADDHVRAKTREVLVDGKGWGRSAELIDCCAAAELPVSVKDFLAHVYALFPRPVVRPIEPAKDKSAAEAVGEAPAPAGDNDVGEANGPTEGGDG